MALDDPLVWVLIAVVVVFLFGASRIPKFARALGEARREFTKGSNPDDSSAASVGSPTTNTQSTPAPAPYPAPPPAPPQTSSEALSPDDPLYIAARNEGIDTRGKTRSQIATELAWRLNKK